VEIIPNGTACWLNQNNAETTPEFTSLINSYIDDATGEVLTALDFGKTVDVTMTVNSKSGLFSSSMPSVNFILSHVYTPLLNTDYQNTATLLRQNFINDRAIQIIGAASVNGEFYGGNYSVIKNCVATYVSAAEVTVTFQAVYSSFLQNYFKARATNNYTTELSVEV
jgi:hypothetical protein